ncbi:MULTISPECIES: hypothetical protein [Acinetobacter calcoaceticus/baumannii complex]|uniref:hypothetical protein n=1 Tax=Acinetobacter calcoaceticus/baumannii complex TaxID=909768 RepID=UPI0023415FFC|nr:MULTISPECIES: hypothetical protein [Acinetobacter calcoaceticus/baumannii complex]EMF0908258.1 hypothetical protein [Acinetobacter baumannii]MDC4478263.1 hypothetical protein [Acinetobacter baumannii]MDX8270387.1 hypothetical protein [Acinetobacter pittii]WEE10773.1 hypothetical protein PX335_16155 [Acinetobacter pittii]HAV5300015.1 hypothetical protein [Acinetobacter baumannii]
MKTFALKNSPTQNSVLEHTPVKDLAAFKQRQQKLKRQKLIKNIFDVAIFINISSFTFSTLFWGA